MLIGRVSELTGATRRAIRHYESIGVISVPQRKGSYRVYSENDVIVINMIRQAQAIGFSLLELKEIVAVKTTEDKFPMKMASELIGNKSLELEQEIESLKLKKDLLNQLKIDLLKTFS
jgi:DNA-binding transcriptional MerR regulator